MSLLNFIFDQTKKGPRQYNCSGPQSSSEFLGISQPLNLQLLIFLSFQRTLFEPQYKLGSFKIPFSTSQQFSPLLSFPSTPWCATHKWLALPLPRPNNCWAGGSLPRANRSLGTSSSMYTVCRTFEATLLHRL